MQSSQMCLSNLYVATTFVVTKMKGGKCRGADMCKHVWNEFHDTLGNNSDQPPGHKPLCVPSAMSGREVLADPINGATAYYTTSWA